MTTDDLTVKREQYERALSLFVDRLKEDRWIVGAVLVGSISEATIWRLESLRLWIIEADGVTRRRKSDGGDERIFRTFMEEGVRIEAELIPRTRFKQMVEGSSRTAFTSNFFAERRLVYSSDESIVRWFDDANTLATKDQDTALLVAATWATHSLEHIQRLISIKGDVEQARQHIVGAGYALAAIEIILRGEVYEEQAIYKAIEYNPALFKVVYTDLLEGPPVREKLDAALAAIDDHLESNWERLLKPLVRYLKKRGGVIPLSEMADEFAHTQIYPWHLRTACEWMVRHGHLDEISMPIMMTKKSRVEVEEPAWELPPS